MTRYFVLAFLTGLVLRYVASRGVISYIKTGKTREELFKFRGFHLSVVSYLVGKWTMWWSGVLGLAYLIKSYFLT